jgi:hypothetical protein
MFVQIFRKFDTRKCADARICACIVHAYGSLSAVCVSGFDGALVALNRVLADTAQSGPRVKGGAADEGSE